MDFHANASNQQASLPRTAPATIAPTMTTLGMVTARGSDCGPPGCYTLAHTVITTLFSNYGKKAERSGGVSFLGYPREQALTFAWEDTPRSPHYRTIRLPSPAVPAT